MYTSQFKEMDPYDWICGPGSHDLLIMWIVSPLCQVLSSTAVCEDECECVMKFRAPQVSEKLEFSLQSHSDTELLDAKTFHLGNWRQRLQRHKCTCFGCVLILLFCSVIVSSSRDILFTHECLIHGCHVQLAYIGWWRCLGCVFEWALLGCIPFSAIPPGDGVTAWASLQCQCGKENIRPSSPNECYTKPTAGHKDRYVHIHIP